MRLETRETKKISWLKKIFPLKAKGPNIFFSDKQFQKGPMAALRYQIQKQNPFKPNYSKARPKQLDESIQSDTR